MPEMHEARYVARMVEGGEIVSETPEVSAERRAEYWKAEHAAANVVIDRLERQRDELAAALREVTTQVSYLNRYRDATRHPDLATALCKARSLLARLGEGGEG